MSVHKVLGAIHSSRGVQALWHKSVCFFYPAAARRLSSYAFDIPFHLEQISISHAYAVLHHDLALLVFDWPREGVIRAVDRAGNDRVGLLVQRLRHGLAIGRHR